PTSLVAASSGSENLEISIYNTLPFVKVNPWYFSFFTPKIRTSLWQFRVSPIIILTNQLSYIWDFAAKTLVFLCHFN
ncbi:MAG: hypothetical protein MR885_10005, partial [Ruminococcus bromii]|nr:hypothetical protein [Ruminococcus bromii]